MTTVATPRRFVPPPWDRTTPAWQALDEQLSADHRARQIDRAVDLLDLTPLRDAYAGVGSEAYPPDVLLKVVLYEMMDGELRPARWARHFRESLPVQWLAFGLRPRRSCLYAFRDRLGDFLVEAHTTLLRLAQDEGFTTADRAALDGTFVAALGSRHRLLSPSALTQRLALLESAVARDQCAAGAVTLVPRAPAATPPTPLALAVAPAGPPWFVVPAPPVGSAVVVAPPATVVCLVLAPPAGTVEPWPAWLAKTPRTRRRQQQRYQQAQACLQQRQRTAPASPRRRRAQRSAPRHPAPERRVLCPSEPEAAVGYDKRRTYRPLYNLQLAYDLDSPFVLGYDLFATVTDAGLLPAALATVQRQTGHLPLTVLSDGIYATYLDLAWCATQQVTLYAPVAEEVLSGSAARLPKSAFRWCADEQTYHCPAGHRLTAGRSRRLGRQKGQSLAVQEFRCPPEHCQACPLQARCTTTPQQGRTVQRTEHDALLEALRARMATAEGQALYRLRKQTVERIFADLRAHRGLERLRGYGLRRAKIQVGLLLLAHNALTLLDLREQRQAAAATPTRQEV